MKHYILIFAIILGLTGCFREELPVPAHEPGDVQEGTVSLGDNYQYQIFLDLETNSEITRNMKTDWLLALEASEEGSYVKLNSSLMIAAWNTGQTNFAAVTNAAGFEAGKVWDVPSGNPDSLALADWKKGTVYVIDRGYDERGNNLGYLKLQYMEATSSEYRIRLGNLSATEGAEVVILKNPLYNYIHIDHLGNTVPVEPARNQWDLAFTQYTHLFTDMTPMMPYLVAGCLINSYNTWVTRITDMAFEDIEYEDVLNLEMSNAADIIGYDWKVYSFDTGSYEVYPQVIYIIKSHTGFYYKFHFTDFYNSKGIKGNPAWELQKL